MNTVEFRHFQPLRHWKKVQDNGTNQWLELDSNPQPLSSKTNTQPFSQTGLMIELLWVLICTVYLTVIISRARFRVNPHSIVTWMSNQAWKFWRSGCHHYCSFRKITVTIIFATYRYHKWRLAETKNLFLCLRNIIIVATIIRFSGEEKFSGLQIISLFMPKGTKLCASNEKRLFENGSLIQK